MKTSLIAFSVASSILAAIATTAWSQAPPTSATIDAEPLSLAAPERFQTPTILEPIRTVSIVAPTDGIVKSLDAVLGSNVRESQQVAELDRSEAALQLKIAEAELRGLQARHAASPDSEAIANAQIDAAEARVELARLQLDRLSLRAPFAGRIVAVPIAPGQFVLKGTVIAEVADELTLKVLAPVDRRTVQVGGDAPIWIEGREQTGKVQSINPLPSSEEYKPLLELAAPFAAAWLHIPNDGGGLTPGLRVRSASLPAAPVAVVPRSAIKPSPGAGSDAMVQVIRAEHVVDVRVKTLGDLGPERVQIAGGFRASDSVILSTSVPLLQGTFVRFGAEGKVEGAPPDRNQPGRAASVEPSAPVAPRARPAVKAPSPKPAAPSPANAVDETPF